MSFLHSVFISLLSHLLQIVSLSSPDWTVWKILSIHSINQFVKKKKKKKKSCLLSTCPVSGNTSHRVYYQWIRTRFPLSQDLELSFYESESHWVMSDFLWHHGLYMLQAMGSQRVGQDWVTEWNWTYGLYGPWKSPGQNTGVGSLSLLQQIFLTQGLNQDLLHCRQTLYQLSYQGSPQHFLKVGI